MLGCVLTNIRNRFSAIDVVINIRNRFSAIDVHSYALVSSINDFWVYFLVPVYVLGFLDRMLTLLSDDCGVVG